MSSARLTGAAGKKAPSYGLGRFLYEECDPDDDVRELWGRYVEWAEENPDAVKQSRGVDL